MEANTCFVLAIVVSLCGLVEPNGLGGFQKIFTGLEKPADKNPLSFLLPHNILPNLEKSASNQPEEDKNPLSFLLPHNILPNPAESTSKKPEGDKNPLSGLLPQNILPDLKNSSPKQTDTDKNPLSALLPHNILPNLTKLLPKQPDTGKNPLSSLLGNGLPDLGTIFPKHHKADLNPLSLLQPDNILKFPFNLQDKVKWLQEVLTKFFAVINSLITESVLDSINLPDLISFYEFVLHTLFKFIGPILQIPLGMLNNKL